MTATKQDLALKIERYNTQLRKAQEFKEKIFDTFVEQGPKLISEIRELLSEIPGLTTTTTGRIDISPNHSTTDLIIRFIDKQVSITPAIQGDRHGLNVIGLYNQGVFFECNLQGEWTALDKTSSRNVKLTSQTVLARLIALVPDVPSSSS